MPRGHNCIYRLRSMKGLPEQDHNLSVQWTKGGAEIDKVWIPDEYKKKQGQEKTQRE
jgi:hypothetical protein